MKAVLSKRVLLKGYYLWYPAGQTVDDSELSQLSPGAWHHTEGIQSDNSNVNSSTSKHQYQ